MTRKKPLTLYHRLYCLLFYCTLSLSISPLPIPIPLALAFIHLFFSSNFSSIPPLPLPLSPTLIVTLTFLPLICRLQIEYTTLGDITVKTEIHYDPDASTTVIEEDKEFVDEYLLLEGTYGRTFLLFVHK